MLYGLIAIGVLLILWLFSTYNKVIAKREAVVTDEKAIGIQLDERNKVFDSMINTVKKYMEHEQGVFSEIVKLRSKTEDGSAIESHEAQEQLSDIINSGKLSAGLNVTMEAYPELKAGTNMLKLQETIESIERRLANSKKAFNMSVEDYNAFTQSIPAVFVVSMFAAELKRDFIRWELSADKIATAEDRVVSF